jgi:hypothetical protein
MATAVGSPLGDARQPQLLPQLNVSAIMLLGSASAVNFTGAGLESSIFTAIGYNALAIYLTLSSGANTTAVTLRLYDFDQVAIGNVTAGGQIVLAAAQATGSTFYVASPLIGGAINGGGGGVACRQWAPYMSINFVASAGTSTVTGRIVGYNT